MEMLFYIPFAVVCVVVGQPETEAELRWLGIVDFENERVTGYAHMKTAAVLEHEREHSSLVAAAVVADGG